MKRLLGIRTSKEDREAVKQSLYRVLQDAEDSGDRDTIDYTRKLISSLNDGEAIGFMKGLGIGAAVIITAKLIMK